MPIDISITLSPREASDEKYYIPAAARAAGVDRSDIAHARIVKRSVDARKKDIRVILRMELYIEGEERPEPVHFDYPEVSNCDPVIVVGCGPAGLFASLRLIELGLRPIIIERGKDVSSRKRDIAAINRNGAVDPDSNYAFGEGGAGTYSDGKLYTRSKKRGDHNKALRTLVFHGADEAILYEAHPHIGTDKLPGVIRNIRGTIEKQGGEVLFGQRVTRLHLDKAGHARGVWCGDWLYEGKAIILATGHSAKDIYRMLHSQGVPLLPKPFAMGVRIEHRQGLIDSIQYKMPTRGEFLPATSYSLVEQVGGRGVYSFCMCPGGFIVPAMTDDGECVVNGMSPSGRNSKYANSGIVTEVREEDFAHLEEEYGVLAGLEYQERFERSAHGHGGPARQAPACCVGDFVRGKASHELPGCSYVPGLVLSDMKWMPGMIYDSLKEGIARFDNKMRGFVTNQVVIVGVESRTSAAVRIPRDRETLEHITVGGLFPAGEGAGYAGGIISAALDGERAADAVNRCVGR